MGNPCTHQERQEMLCRFVSSRSGRTNDRSKRKDWLQLITEPKRPQRKLVRDVALSEFTSQDGNRTRTPLYRGPGAGGATSRFAVSNLLPTFSAILNSPDSKCRKPAASNAEKTCSRSRHPVGKTVAGLRQRSNGKRNSLLLPTSDVQSLIDRHRE